MSGCGVVWLGVIYHVMWCDVLWLGMTRVWCAGALCDYDMVWVSVV